MYEHLVATYTEPHRCYHTLTHIQSMLKDAAYLSVNHALTREAYYAIWWHDAVYQPGASDNEEKSAAAFEAFASDETSGFRKRVSAIIRATAHHDETQPKLSDNAKLVLDADLAGMGRTYKGYWHNAELIIKEFQPECADEFIEARSGWLRSMLDRDHIFYTPVARKMWEPRARSNMKTELYHYAQHTLEEVQAMIDALCGRTP